MEEEIIAKACNRSVIRWYEAPKKAYEDGLENMFRLNDSRIFCFFKYYRLYFNTLIKND